MEEERETREVKTAIAVRCDNEYTTAVRSTAPVYMYKQDTNGMQMINYLMYMYTCNTSKYYCRVKNCVDDNSQ